MSDWYDVSGAPATNAFGYSAQMRTEFASVATAMAKLPTLTASGLFMLRVNAAGTAIESVDPATVTTFPFVRKIGDTMTGTLAITPTAGNSLLNLNAVATAEAQLRLSGNGLVAGTTSFDLISNATAAYAWQRANLPLIFGTNNIERLRIDTAGKITTAATGVQAGVFNGTAGTGVRFDFQASGATNGYIGLGSTVVTGAALTDFCIAVNTGSIKFGVVNGTALAMTIDSSGQVAIGTTPTSWKFHVATTGQNIAIFDSTHASKGFVQWATNSAGYGFIGNSLALMTAGVAANLCVRSEAALDFSVAAGNFAARIDASGNFGIGEAPSAKLQVLQTVAGAGTLYVSNTGATTTSLIANFSNRTDADFGINLSGVGAATKFVSIGPSVGVPLVFQTTNIERMRISAAGDVSIAGTGNLSLVGGVVTSDYIGPGVYRAMKTGGQATVTSSIDNCAVYLATATLDANQRVYMSMSLLRENFQGAGSGNDLNDKVGLWIKGFYSGVGGNPPIYLGGTGFNSGNCALHITTANTLLEGLNGFELGYKGIPQSSVTTGAFSASDRGKLILAAGGITVPNSTMSAGDTVTIFNNTGGNITLTASVGSLYLGGTTLTGNRVLAARGVCTILFITSTSAVITGAGVS